MGTRKLHLIVGPLTANTARFAALQTTTGGTPWTLTATVKMAQPAASTHVTAAPVSITSGAAWAGGAITITGLDRAGQPVTEVITALSTSGLALAAGVTTIYTNALFSSVISITSAVTEGAHTVSAGMGATNYSPWLISGYEDISIQAIVLAAGNYNVQVSSQNFLDPYAYTGWVPNMASGLLVPQSPYQAIGADGVLIWPALAGSINAPGYEDDGTFSGGQFISQTLTTAAPQSGALTTGFISTFDTKPFAVRIVNTTATIQLDVNTDR
jgi:hypothetical protein